MKFAVIGLGRFGYQVATVLAENGMEVIAIDSSESIIASIRDSVTQAVCVRVTDEESLRSIGIADMDTVIVATGESFAESILITALLKKHLNVPLVIARAINDIHKEILTLIGADRVILPEKDIGIKVADNLSSPFMDISRLSNNFSISQVVAPASFIGKSIAEIDNFSNHEVRCIGIKEANDEIVPVGLDYIIKAGNRLVLSGINKALVRFARE